MAGKLSRARLIAAPPAIVTTIAADVFNFLKTLPVADFQNAADTKALWAVEVNDTGEEGSLYPSTGGTAATWVVSAEAFKRIKASRF